MSTSNIAILDYGIGNLRSAEKALQKVGANAFLTADPKKIAAADGVVLPGVGAFGACMKSLHASGLAEQVHEVVAREQPLLGVCVGMQLLYEGSEESPGVPGLGIFTGTVQELPAGVIRPQMQWNKLETASSHYLLEGLDDSWVYFVHSYVAPSSEHVIATVSYGGDQPAAVAKGQICATQFHPEKSSESGLKILSNFIDRLGVSS